MDGLHNSSSVGGTLRATHVPGIAGALLLGAGYATAYWGWGGASAFHMAVAAALAWAGVACVAVSSWGWRGQRPAWLWPAVVLMVLGTVGLGWSVNLWRGVLAVGYGWLAVAIALAVARMPLSCVRPLLGLFALVTALGAGYGLLQQAGYGSVDHWHNSQLSSRFVNSAHFAGGALAGLCLQWGLCCSAKRWGRALWILCMVTTAAALLLSGCRTAWLVGGAVGGWMLLVQGLGRARLHRLPGWVAWVSVGCVVIATGYAGLRLEVVRSRLGDIGRTGGQSLHQRLEVWEDTARMIAATPEGVGAGCYAECYPAFKGGANRFAAQHAHNEWLELLAELGWLAVFPLALFSVAVCLMAYRLGCAQARGERLVLQLGAQAGVLALLFHSLLDFPLRLPANILLFAVLMGGLLPPASPAVPQPIAARARWVAGAVAAVCVVLWGYVAIWGWHWERAFDALQLRQQRAAADHLLVAQRLIPWHGESAYELGRLTLAWSELPFGMAAGALRTRAVSHFEAAVSAAPCRAVYHLDLATARVAAGETRGAETAYLRAIACDPFLGIYHLRYADFLLDGGRAAEAAAHYRSALASFHDSADMHPRDIFDRLLRITRDPAFVERCCPPDTRSRMFLRHALDAAARRRAGEP